MVIKNRFTFTVMNHSIDIVIDTLLTNTMYSGIESITSKDPFYIVIEFKDGCIFEAWNCNRYYSWLYKGVFTSPDCRYKRYEWEDARPRKATMARLYNMIETFIK